MPRHHLSKLPHGQDVPEIKLLNIVLEKLLAHYKVLASWDTQLTVPFTWYWEILYNTCQMVKPDVASLDLSWCSEGEVAVLHLARLYSVYIEKFNVTFQQSVPDAVAQCKNDHMRKYFQWIQEMQQHIHSWERKVRSGDWTEAEIKDYARIAKPLHNIARFLHMEVIEEVIAKMEREMRNLKSIVNETIIRKDTEGRR